MGCGSHCDSTRCGAVVIRPAVVKTYHCNIYQRAKLYYISAEGQPPRQDLTGKCLYCYQLGHFMPECAQRRADLLGKKIRLGKGNMLETWNGDAIPRYPMGTSSQERANDHLRRYPLDQQKTAMVNVVISLERLSELESSGGLTYEELEAQREGFW